MALIDEYKQAIQDVLDGRAKPAPKPSELPWTEDKAATMWAAAAAELIAEDRAGGGGSGGGALMVTVDANDYPEKTYAEIAAAAAEGPVILKYSWGTGLTEYYYLAYTGWDDMEHKYMVSFSNDFLYGADTQDGVWTYKAIMS